MSGINGGLLYYINDDYYDFAFSFLTHDDRLSVSPISYHTSFMNSTEKLQQQQIIVNLDWY